jgi:hypothetical protein
VTFDFLVIIVILNMMATITLWRTAARKPAKLKKKFVSALLSSEPIVPNHRPPVIGEGFLSKAERQFFIDFEDFADVVNWWLADELSELAGDSKYCPTPIANMGFRTCPSLGGGMTSFTIRSTSARSKSAPAWVTAPQSQMCTRASS